MDTLSAFSKLRRAGEWCRKIAAFIAILGLGFCTLQLYVYLFLSPITYSPDMSIPLLQRGLNSLPLIGSSVVPIFLASLFYSLMLYVVGCAIEYFCERFDQQQPVEQEETEDSDELEVVPL